MDWSIYAKDPNGEGVIFPEGNEELFLDKIWQLRVTPWEGAVLMFRAAGELDAWGLVAAPYCLDTDYYTCWSASEDLQLRRLHGAPIGG